MSRLPATTHATRASRPVVHHHAARGVARWLEGEGSRCPETGNPYLRITVEVGGVPSRLVARDYAVERVWDHLFRLTYLDPRTYRLVQYTITICGVGDWRCDGEHCPVGCCKHVRGLRAALATMPL